MDGFEVLRRLRGDGQSLPVIMLTARSSARDAVDGLDAGASDYVPKPFSSLS
jgi:DNA-binding response OmpR family regulator